MENKSEYEEKEHSNLYIKEATPKKHTHNFRIINMKINSYKIFGHSFLKSLIRKTCLKGMVNTYVPISDIKYSAGKPNFILTKH